MFLVSNNSIYPYETLSVDNTKFLVYRESHKVPFQIVWHGNGAEMISDQYVSDLSIDYFIGDTLEIPQTYWWSYRFLGWNYSETEQGNYISTNTKCDYYNRDIWAHWLSSVKVYFDSDYNTPGGNWYYPDGEDHFYFEGEEFGILPECDPNNGSYLFLGWFDSPAGGNQITEDSIVPGEPISAYAQYEEVQLDSSMLFYNGTGEFHWNDNQSGVELENVTTFCEFDGTLLETYSINFDYYPNHIEGNSYYAEGCTPCSLKIQYDSNNEYSSIYLYITFSGVEPSTYAYLNMDVYGWMDQSDCTGYLDFDRTYGFEKYNEDYQTWEYVDFSSIDFYPTSFYYDGWSYSSVFPYLEWTYSDDVGTYCWCGYGYDQSYGDYRYMPVRDSYGNLIDMNGQWRVTLRPYIDDYSGNQPNMYVGCFNFYGSIELNQE